MTSDQKNLLNKKKEQLQYLSILRENTKENIITLKINETVEENSVFLSSDLTVIQIEENSCLFDYLVLGDKIIEDSGKKLQNEAISLPSQKLNQWNIKIVRVGNYTPIPKNRFKNIGLEGREPGAAYFCINVQRPICDQTELGVTCYSNQNTFYILATEPNTVGEATFLEGDRVLDIEGEKFGSSSQLNELLDKGFQKNSSLSFAIERAVGKAPLNRSRDLVMTWHLFHSSPLHDVIKVVDEETTHVKKGKKAPKSILKKSTSFSKNKQKLKILKETKNFEIKSVVPNNLMLERLVKKPSI
uniref:PDZ domain-containing protein n=1 Tax=Strongyloides stercoralis TaxID=6248 RepID=A0A0K0EEV6_STRER